MRQLSVYFPTLFVSCLSHFCSAGFQSVSQGQTAQSSSGEVVFWFGWMKALWRASPRRIGGLKTKQTEGFWYLQPLVWGDTDTAGVLFPSPRFTPAGNKIALVCILTLRHQPDVGVLWIFCWCASVIVHYCMWQPTGRQVSSPWCFELRLQNKFTNDEEEGRRGCVKSIMGKIKTTFGIFWVVEVIPRCTCFQS